MRIEHDLLGKIVVPDDVYYGGQTQRALTLCNPSGQRLNHYPSLIRAIAIIKKSAALAHLDLLVLDNNVCTSIVKACDEIIKGKYNDQFRVDIFSGGGGVAINMNLNEVIANRANEVLTGQKGYSHVHPNTHVNMGQSTNDVLPSAMKLALHEYLLGILSALQTLITTVEAKSNEYKDVVKVSRTCLQDAVPITFGQTLSGFTALLNRQHRQITELLNELIELPMCATAVGTGLGSYAGFSEKLFEQLNTHTNLKLEQESNLFDALQNGDVYIKISAQLKSLSTGISKFAKDLRLLSSGPRTGLNEISIAPTQNGSSIMPGKVNPALPELMIQVAYQACGNDVSISMAVEGGELDLNVWEAVIIKNLFETCDLLTKTIPVFADKCVQTIVPNTEVCQRNADQSLALAVIVSASFGYATGSKVAKLAADENLSIKEACIQLNLFNETEANEMLDPLMLTDPIKSGELLLKLKRKELAQ